MGRSNTRRCIQVHEDTKDDAIFTQVKNKTYAGLIKTITTSVNPSEQSAAVKTMKKQEKGNSFSRYPIDQIRLTLLKRELIEKITAATTSLLVRHQMNG